jgi:hypothetical protein
MDLRRRLRPVDVAIVVAERPGIRRPLLELRVPAVAGLQPRERLRQQLLGELGEQGLERGEVDLLGHRTRPLRQDRPRVEVVVHEVVRHPELAVALANGPRERVRPAVPGQEAEMAVDGAELRDREDLGRQLPPVAGTQPEPRLVHPRHALEARLAVGDADIQPGGRPCNEFLEAFTRPRVGGVTEPRHDHRDRLVPLDPRDRVEPDHDRQHHRVDDDAARHRALRNRPGVA